MRRNITITFVILICIIGMYCFLKLNTSEKIRNHIVCNDVCKINQIIRNKDLSQEIYKHIDLTPNTIKNYKWIDDEHNCFRVRLSDINKPENVEVNCIRDYFFIINNGKIIQVINSDYSGKDLLSNGEHNAYFEDVTFDGNKDLIVGLYTTITGNSFNRAYIFKGGKYEYVPSFENIPNYKVKHDTYEILGYSKDSACSYTYYHYSYDGVFNKQHIEERNDCL